MHEQPTPAGPGHRRRLRTMVRGWAEAVLRDREWGRTEGRPGNRFGRRGAHTGVHPISPAAVCHPNPLERLSTQRRRPKVPPARNGTEKPLCTVRLTKPTKQGGTTGHTHPKKQQKYCLQMWSSVGWENRVCTAVLLHFQPVKSLHPPRHNLRENPPNKNLRFVCESVPFVPHSCLPTNRTQAPPPPKRQQKHGLENEI